MFPTTWEELLVTVASLLAYSWARGYILAPYSCWTTETKIPSSPDKALSRPHIRIRRPFSHKRWLPDDLSPWGSSRGPFSRMPPLLCIHKLENASLWIWAKGGTSLLLALCEEWRLILQGNPGL